MQTGSWCLALLSAVFSVAGFAGGPGVSTELVGGTLGFAAKSDVRLDLTGAEDLVLQGGKNEFRVPFKKVNVVEYGQSVSRRYAEAILISPIFLLSKSRKHFVTVGFSDGSGQQQVVVLRVSKGDIRSVLSSLEARTGRRVEYQDDEARRSGR